MSQMNVDRRGFLKKASALTASAAAVFGFEERQLLAYQEGRGQAPIPAGPQDGTPGASFMQGGRGPAQAPAPMTSPGPMPKVKLAPGLEVSRLIAGHNLVVFQAHSRDLIYVSALLKAYFTPAKIEETYQKYEEVGINASWMRVADDMLTTAAAHNKRGGKIQWIAQLVINEKDFKHDIDVAMEKVGPKGAYIRGLEGDSLWQAGKMDVIAKAIDYAKSTYKIPVGLATHSIEPHIAAEKMGGLNADFYVKTFNSGSYWSAGAPLTPDPNWKPTAKETVPAEYAAHGSDSIWETTPKGSTQFFKGVKKPMVGYKVLAAGAIRPRDGFKWAFDNGCDAITIGMYDFQVVEDAEITKTYFKDGLPKRDRPWINA